MTDDIKKISANKEKKQKIVAQLSEKTQKAKAMVFTNYQGMTHKQLEELKKALKPIDAELVVAKNTLLKIALKEVSTGKTPSGTSDTSDTFDTFLNGQTATLFAYSDVVSPLKELAKLIKTLKLPASPDGKQGGPEIKFGILEGKIITEQEVVKLSSLPSREVLLAQLVGGLKSPIFGLHRALNWNLQKLVMTLKAIETTKSV